MLCGSVDLDVVLTWSRRGLDVVSTWSCSTTDGDSAGERKRRCESYSGSSSSGEVDVWREERNGRLRPAKVR
jgi:hypothetical protein